MKIAAYPVYDLIELRDDELGLGQASEGLGLAKVGQLLGHAAGHVGFMCSVLLCAIDLDEETTVLGA
jgi:hypothetical protein